MNKKKMALVLMTASAASITTAHFTTQKAYATELNENNSQSKSEVKKGKVVNVNTSLRIRKSSNINSEVIGHLANGEVFVIKGKSSEWYHVNANGKIGYVHKDYVQEIEGTSSSGGGESATSSRGQVVNVTSSLRVRASGSTNSKIVGHLSPSQTFNIKSKNGEWYHIDANGLVGHVHEDYVKELNGNSSDEIPPTDDNVKGKGKVINVTSSLRIRSSASTNSAIVGSLSPGQTFDIKGKSGSWYHINSNGTVGYVHGDYVKEISDENNSGDGSQPEESNEFWGKVVNVSTSLRVRTKPSTNSTIIGSLYPGEKVKVLATSGNWYKINFNGSTGYVSKDYISKTEGNNEDSNEDSTATFNKVFSIMKEHIGTPYIYGGSGEYLTASLLKDLRRRFPDHAARGFYDINPRFVDAGYRAFDCSGLMQWAFNKVGIGIGRTTWDQIEAGVEVNVKNVKPGDLLFYHDLGHVGMYIGNNQWIESPNKNATIRITNVQWNKIGRARRIIR
ncbi:SH3 domain-containing protein [Clostridium tarantellae]|uniref:SH3 domain-containing protein n=1 Tax=Clostridium tarantellae TaxID=39493 RepID=A0A6I1MUX3_9CLOT|nr:SH3 domain-containing protein [Clostridium tarantellae]MPQ44009.1 SH3 domain-containing protein [Clostridium tarantellae]